MDTTGQAWHFVNPDHTEVIANVDTYSHPATITFSATVEQYQKIGEKAWSSGDIEFYYGRSVDITIPAYYTSMPHFVGETLQHGKFDFILSQPGSAPFVLMGTPEQLRDGSYIVHYSLARPDWDTWN